MAKPRRHNKWTYRSGLEGRVGAHLRSLSTNFGHEVDKIKYTVPESGHVYTPDFTVKTSKGKTIYIETKGIWDYDDRYKHLLIKQQHPELDIRFVFSNSKAKIRKGSKTTYADICNGLGRAPFKDVTWQFADKLIPAEWLEE